MAGEDRHGPASGNPAPRLLVAEADPANQRLLDIILSSLGYELTFAEDGIAAVEAAEAQAFDLVLVDLGLPGLDALEAARRIRALPEPRGTVAIVGVGAHAPSKADTESLAAAMDAWLAKPIDVAQLAATVAAFAGAAPQLSRSGGTR